MAETVFPKNLGLSTLTAPCALMRLKQEDTLAW
jgi:hypothetical protein